MPEHTLHVQHSHEFWSPIILVILRKVALNILDSQKTLLRTFLKITNMFCPEIPSADYMQCILHDGIIESLHLDGSSRILPLLAQGYVYPFLIIIRKGYVSIMVYFMVEFCRESWNFQFFDCFREFGPDALKRQQPATLPVSDERLHFSNGFFYAL